jgi:hypothetical protein
MATSQRSWAKVVAGDYSISDAAMGNQKEVVRITTTTWNREQVVYNCRRVPVEGGYSKYITDCGNLLILTSIGYGAGWSTWCNRYGARDPVENQRLNDLKKRILMDSRIIDYVASPEFKSIFSLDSPISYEEREKIKKSLMMEILGLPEDKLPYIGGFENLVIDTVPIGSRFRLTEYDGAEGIEIYREESYYIA